MSSLVGPAPGNWGRSAQVITQNAAPTNALWEAMAEIRLPSDENNGFNVTIVPGELINGVFTESLYYRIDFGGGGISQQTLERTTKRPVTVHVPGSYARVQVYIRTDAAGEAPGVQRQVAAFISPYHRSLKYPLCSGSQTINLASGIANGQVISFVGRNVRALYCNVTDGLYAPHSGGAAIGPSPINLSLIYSTVGGLPSVLTTLVDVTQIVEQPLRIPDDCLGIYIERLQPGNVLVALWFEEEL